MARLLSGKPEEETPVQRGAASLFVNGARYVNAAAKFWSSLIDELREDFPECSTIELSSSSPGKLHHDLLYPHRAMERDLNNLLFCDLETMMKETIAELEIIGPPSSVAVRLLSGKTELLAGQLPLDCVDAEIFPYLIVWPLEWANIPDNTWNTECLSGNFAAEDRKRHLEYAISLELTTQHISEGLYRRCISVSASTNAIEGEHNVIGN
jgi:hypothetical protein